MCIPFSLLLLQTAPDKQTLPSVFKLALLSTVSLPVIVGLVQTSLFAPLLLVLSHGIVGKV